MARIVRIAYPSDSASLFERIRDLPWSVMLESSRSYLPDARYDILAADPVLRVMSDGPRTRIESSGKTKFSSLDPLTVVSDLLDDPVDTLADLPFAGGALGYVSYDYGRRHEHIGTHAAADIDIPDIALGIYDWAVVVDHAEQACWLASHGRYARTLRNWDRLAARLSAPAKRVDSRDFTVTSRLESNLNEQEYKLAFDAAKKHIAAGDCYQVNLTQRFSARADGDAWAAYRRLSEISPAPYAAWLDYPFASIACSSPEQFVSLRGRQARTSPIKGTRPRAESHALDDERKRQLHQSEKDRAENVMIVDLLRNDFGRCCKPGSVDVSRLFDVESFANVHHLVSTVVGTLRESCDATDLLVACFPGGSISGAPKIRAMQVIDDLEPQRRSIYCGAIGYLGYDGNMDTNIVIRSLLLAGGSVFAWAGGGIVADSRWQEEYQESLDKASAMLQVLSEFSAA